MFRTLLRQLYGVRVCRLVYRLAVAGGANHLSNPSSSTQTHSRPLCLPTGNRLMLAKAARARRRGYVAISIFSFSNQKANVEISLSAKYLKERRRATSACRKALHVALVTRFIGRIHQSIVASPMHQRQRARMVTRARLLPHL